MKKTIVLSLLLLIVINSLIGQTNLIGENNLASTNNVLLNNGSLIVTPLVKKEIKGTPYLFNNWDNNSQIFINDDVYNVPSFNYNIRSERFESKFSKDSTLIINPRYITKVVINNKVFKRYLDPECQRNSYFEEVIGVNDIVLIKKYVVQLKEGVINPMTFQKTSPDILVKNEQYYLKNKENKIKKVKLRKSTILSIIQPDKRDNIKDYSKENKLKYGKVNDVVKLLNYYKTI